MMMMRMKIDKIPFRKPWDLINFCKIWKKPDKKDN